MVNIPGVSDSTDQLIEDDVAPEATYSRWKTAKVVVTGFGPFKNITDNPSFKIAQALSPEILIGGENGAKIKVVCHPTPVHVAWQTVVKLIPQLYDQHAPRRHPHATRSEPHDLPFFVHIGAGYNGVYELEGEAHRDGYSKLDVDGKLPPIQSDDEKKRGFPILDGCADEILETGIDVDGVVDDADGEIADVPMPLNVSHDAGNYLCDFIYYTSLYEATKRWGPEGRKQVLFVHVPPDGKLEDGVRVLTAVLRGIVRRAQ